MKSTHSFLLAGTALLAVTALPPFALADAPAHVLLAQAAPPANAPAPDKEKKEPEKKEQAPTAKPAAPPAAQQKPPAPPAAAAQQQQPKPPAAAQQEAPKPAAPPAAAAQQKPADKPAAAPAQAPAAQAGDRGERREERREQRREERRDERRDRRDATPAQKPADSKPSASQPPATAPQPAAKSEPNKPAETPKGAAQPAAKPAEAPKAAQPAAPPAAAPKSATQPAAPATQQPAAQQPAQADQKAAPQQAAPAVVPQPPTQPRDAREFIRRDNQAAQRSLDDIRRERRQIRQGDRTIISEGDRTIVRQDNRTIIRHNEAARFAIGARDVRVDRRGGETFTVIARPNGISIVTVTDADGRLIRRVRRDARGRELVIIDNRRRGPRAEVFIDLAPPRVRIPRERYIVEAARARPAEIYEVFLAPPIERLERSYTLEQVRYSEPLRARMPRVDLDINFETGSWQLTPDQVDKLAAIAEGLNRAISRSPREVFLIEGHTDAVGSDEDNLSLSDRRAEAVAVALTEQFQVPAENLVTQGYGEEQLKVQSEGAERANRRVAVRRITPLMAEARARR